jgi:plasmid stabilization system protein ParE
MPSLIFSHTALRDLERLRAFLRAKNLQAARRAVDKIMHGLQALGQHSELGHQVENRPEDYRELVIPFGKDGYIAAYRYSGDSLVVLGVRHQRELQPPAL